MTPSKRPLSAARAEGKASRLLLVTLLVLIASSGAARQPPAESLVGRLLMLAYHGTDAPLVQLEELGPGGFLFYPSNLPSTETARSVTRRLQEAAAHPLLFGIDQEGGPFTSYRSGEATLFPGNMALAATGDPSLATRVGEATGRELAHAGFNMNFAPVVDVAINPDNPIIGIRSFGADVDVVGAFGAAYLQGLEAAGVAAVAKHFPGHGDTAADSHLELPSVTGDLARLRTVELPPFETLIEAGVPAIMTAHVAFPAIEAEVPATLSRAALDGLLRQELGFEGLLVTDYMDMQAIAQNYGPGEAAVMSVIAGADLVLLGPDPEVQRAVHAALVEALRSGRLSEERVREAVHRSERVATLHPPRWDDPAPDYGAHRALAEEVAELAATLLWNDGVLPLDPRAQVLVVAPQPGGFGQPPHLGEVLAREHDRVRTLAISEDPTPAEVDEAVRLAGSADVVVLGSYHWLGAFPAGSASLAAGLAETGRPVVVVALGNPDDARFLPVRPDAYLAVYGYREANLRGAAAILTGRREPHGKVPVPVGSVPLGSGLDGYR